MSLLVLRLKGRGETAEAVSQALFDAFVQGLEDGFRQQGISDTGVAKRMKKLGQAAYGRLHGYEAALTALPDRSGLDAFVARTVCADGGAAGPLAVYIADARDALAAQSIDLLCGGAVEWPSPQETPA
jgi:cytochrome b pre-mRNA-processing protein 3